MARWWVRQVDRWTDCLGGRPPTARRPCQLLDIPTRVCPHALPPSCLHRRASLCRAKGVTQAAHLPLPRRHLSWSCASVLPLPGYTCRPLWSTSLLSAAPRASLPETLQSRSRRRRCVRCGLLRAVRGCSGGCASAGAGCVAALGHAARACAAGAAVDMSCPPSVLLLLSYVSGNARSGLPFAGDWHR